jgi:hypothetical protein
LPIYIHTILVYTILRVKEAQATKATTTKILRRYRNMKKEVRRIRKMVCIMANELHRAGLSLSEAFKKAWRRVKVSMRMKVAGTTFCNRQQVLRWMDQFTTDQISVTLEREPENKADSKAIRIVAHVAAVGKRAVIGYIPKVVNAELAKIMDAGIQITADFLGITGGYGYKENYGALIQVNL